MNQTNNRSFSAYLTANFSQPFFMNNANEGQQMDEIDDWYTEIDAYVTGAIAERPALHPERAKLTAARQSIQRTVANLRREGNRWGASQKLFQMGVAYKSLDQITKVGPAPANHALDWTGAPGWEHLFVHNTSVGLDQTDCNQIYNAMMFGGNARHNSNNAVGVPQGMLWYTHNYADNRIIAVTAFSAAARTVTAPKAGNVNNREHRFR